MRPDCNHPNQIPLNLKILIHQKEILKNAKLIINLKEIEKSTGSVDVRVKREIFEVQVEGIENKTRGSINNTKSEIIESKSKCPKENWNLIQQKHCPLTANLVSEDKENRLKSSILVSNKKQIHSRI